MLDKLFVEFLGTFIFLSVILMSGGNALYIGIALAAAILFGGAISGGHFNPAVSIMQYYGKMVTGKQATLYIIVQVLAGIAAFMFYKRYVLNRELGQ